MKRLSLGLVLLSLAATDASAAPGKVSAGPAIASLLERLDDPSDWCKVITATQALGKLRTPNAQAALEQVARDYWFPPVRAVAWRALDVLRGRDGYANTKAPTDGAFFVSCDRIRELVRSGPEAPLMHGLGELHGEQLKAHPYKVASAAIDTPEAPVGHVPTTGLAVSGGFLLGTLREAKGELVFTDEVAAPKLVIAEGTFALHRLGSRIVAVTGRDVTPSRGALYLISQRDDGVYEATWWKRLPGAPVRTGFLPDGALLIECRQGDMIVERDGTVRQMLGSYAPRPVAEMIDELKSLPMPTPELTDALVKAGEPAAAALGALVAEGDRRPGISLFISACRILQQMGEHAVPAIEPLLMTVKGSSDLSTNRIRALEALACVGEHAQSAVPALEGIVAAAPIAVSTKRVEPVLRRIRMPAATPLWVSQLSTFETVAHAAAAGPNAREAGAAFVRLLDSDDPELREQAAFAIGDTDYVAGLGSLISRLDDVTDWRVIYAAAESLGRMRAGIATARLERVARDHWFPVVRAAASKALRAIRGTDRYETKWDEKRGLFSFGPRTWSEVVPYKKPGVLPKLARGAGELGPEQLKDLTYPAPSDGGDPKSIVRTQTPGAGLSLDAGFLVGQSKGEWGGELVHLATEGAAPTFLLHTNTHSIHRLGEHVVAITGVSHMSINEGAAYLVEPDADGTLHARLWRTLPGAPSQTGFLADGDLFIRCEGGDVVLDEDGDLRMYK